MKGLLAFLCALALIVALTGCTAPDMPERPENSAPTAPTEPQPEPIPPQTQPVVTLTCLDLPEGMLIDHAVPLGGGRLTVNCSRWDYTGDMPERYDDCTYLVDTLQDRVMGSVPGWQGVMGQRKNGEILVMDQEADKLRFYDAAFTLLREEPLPPDAFAAIFDRRRDRLCWQENNTLSCISLETGERQVYTFEEEATVEAYDPLSGLLVYTLPSAGEVSEADWVLYDTDKGEIRGTGPCEAAYTLQFANGTLISSAYETAGDGSADSENMSVVFTLYDPADGRITKRWSTREAGYWECLFHSPYLAGATTDYNSETEQERGVFILIDLSTGRLARPVDMEGLIHPGVCRDPDTGRVFLYGEEQGRGALRVIEPTLVNFDQQMEPAALPAPRQIGILGSAFRELRAVADAVEADYPVRILLGDEVKNTHAPGDYTLVSLEETDRDQAPVLEETQLALQTVRSALAAYPEGFFDRFRNSRGQGGVRILLVEEIQSNQYESFNAAGIAYGFGAWYNVALEVGEVQRNSSVNMVHHELWHSTENRITDLEPDAFYFADWSALNPTGFDYGMDFDHYYEEDSLDKYIFNYGSARDQAYFISSYSTVTAMEDRATLLEILFCPDDVEDFYPGYDSYYQAVCDYPHLKEKLDEMGKWTKKVFGYVYWEEMLNERDTV